MKPTYLLAIALFSVLITQAQIIDIPDANFKNVLVNTPCVSFDEYSWNLVDADTNDDGEIQVSEAEAVQLMGLWNTDISSIEGIENFTNLKYLSFENSPLKYADLSFNLSLTTISFYDMNELTSIFIKNGVDNDYVDPQIGEGGLYADMCPNLTYICADDFEIAGIQGRVGGSVTVNSYCASETAGDVVYIINGENKLDADLNSCDTGDSFVSELKYTISNGIDSAIIFTDSYGNFSFPVHQDGTHTVTPIMVDINDPDYYTVSPTNIDVTFPASTSPTNMEFCITPNGPPIVYFPDSIFKNAILNQTPVIDTNADGEIQVSEAESATVISVQNNTATSIEGIEYFINLVNLSIVDTQIESIDLSPFNLLETLDVTENLLTQLDVSQNPNLTSLSCGNISSLCEYGCYNQPSEDYSNNNIDNVDVSQNSNLVSLDIENGGVSNLILNNPNLVTLRITENPLSGLNVTQSPNLETLIANNANLTEIDLSQNPLLSTFLCYNDYFTLSTPGDVGISNELPYDNSLTTLDISANPLITNLFCFNNGMENLILGTNPNISSIRCEQNQITSLDISGCPNLNTLTAYNNQLATLNLINTPSLSRIDCYNNQLTDLDISQSPNLTRLFAYGNPLESLNIKNGSGFAYDYYELEFHFAFDISTANLQYICADDFEIDEIQTEVGNSVEVNDYCSFNPGGTYYTLEGQSKFDIDNNGCNTGDNSFPYLKLNVSNGTNNSQYISNSNGNYTINVITGEYTVTPILENPDYFTISPSNYTVDFPTDTSPFIQNFCITPNGTFNDLDITILPVNQARPGFDGVYKIIYKNHGDSVLSGTVDFTFSDDLMDIVSTNPVANSQATGLLSWNYTNLAPFESGEVMVTMNLNTPADTPALNGGEVLAFTASINPITGDETPDDNSFTLNQDVVNSYDPNDKTCLEGNTITPDLIGEDVHYLIRFENTGTASAINVVVKDIIDTTKFDVSTLFLTDVSHDVVTRINNGNEVEFVFENINLPFDDATNDGYIAFKIKTLPTLVAGDTFENDAEIYFDFNFPIDTNIATTTVESTLNTAGFEMANIDIYPNPVQNRLMIKGQDVIKSVAVYDISGRLINQVSFIGDQTEVSVSTEALAQGSYFVNVKTTTGEGVRKLVKE